MRFILVLIFGSLFLYEGSRGLIEEYYEREAIKQGDLKELKLSKASEKWGGRFVEFNIEGIDEKGKLVEVEVNYDGYLHFSKKDNATERFSYYEYSNNGYTFRRIKESKFHSFSEAFRSLAFFLAGLFQFYYVFNYKKFKRKFSSLDD